MIRDIDARLSDNSGVDTARENVIEQYAKASGIHAIAAALAQLEQRPRDASTYDYWTERVRRAMRSEADA